MTKITLRTFNRLPIPAAVVAQAAEQAAFEAVNEFHLAKRALATPFARGRVLSLHADVRRAEALAASLARGMR